MRRNGRTALFGAAALAAGWALVRFVFFGLHGMKQWPTVLAAAGLVLLLVCALCGLRRAAMLVPVGYFAGFWAGILFAAEGTDPGGGRSANGWLIWTAVLLALWALGLLWELLARRRADRADRT